MTVAEVVARVPAWAGSSTVRVTPLAGGITNENYHVEVDGRPFVVRLGGRDTEFLGIDRARERAAAMAAARLGVGPEVVWALPEEAVLVTRFVPGRVLAAEDLRDEGVLARVVAALRRVHQGPPIPGRFSPFRTVKAYHDVAARHGVTPPAAFDDWLALSRRIEARLASVPTVPCHNDLLAANFIDDGARLSILDWEYAAMGNPFFDLGNLAANAEMDGDAECRLLELYARRASAEALARIGLMRLASDLREAMWGLVQVGISRLAFDFAGYADRHFARFAARSASPEVTDWLRSSSLTG